MEGKGLDDPIQYIKLAKTSDFVSVRIKSYRILARPVGIVRNSDGTFFATEISCKHQNADLSTGRIRGDLLTCPRHGWQYNLQTGECVNHDSTPLRRYALKVEDGDIFVSLRPISREGDYT